MLICNLNRYGYLFYGLNMFFFMPIQIDWYDNCLNALNDVERLYQNKDVADIIQAKVVQVCHSNNQTYRQFKRGTLAANHS